jgi:hypothetical protein
MATFGFLLIVGTIIIVADALQNKPRASVTADMWIGVALRVSVFMVLAALIVIIAVASPGDRLLSVAVIALAVTLIRWAGVSGKRVWLYVGLLLLLFAKPIF